MDLDQACPKCRTTLYRNPNMKLLVNVCGHNLCETCVELLFAKGSGPCPECNTPLRRTNFRLQLFEDASIDKEVDIRRRILRDFNKKEDDFPDQRAYDDYLEMVEDIIFNLANNIDVLETNKRIAAYKEAHKDSIPKNRLKLSRDAVEIENILLAEAKEESRRQKVLRVEEEQSQKRKTANKEKLIDDLMFSDANAADIVSQHAKELVKAEEEATAPKFSTGAKIGAGAGPENTADGGAGLPVEPAKPYVYEEPLLEFNGPGVIDELDVKKGYWRHVRGAETAELAAGYHQDLACTRALQEAMSDLFY